MTTARRAMIRPIDGAATWRSGDAAACKAVYAGSIPAVASINRGVLRQTWPIYVGFREN